MRSAVLAAALMAVSAPAFAQSNAIDGLDVRMHEISDLVQMGRVGSFPNGMNGLSFQTTCCNPGTVDVPWEAAMDKNHPLIAFIVVRETDGRFMQISDWSYVKHGFFSVNSNDCGSCQTSDGSVLGVNCSDTYGAWNNGDRYWLGPPEEIDPWLGLWGPTCSHFDRGEPPVPPPFDCDAERSLSDSQISALGPVAHRVEVSDADLNVANSRFFFYGIYVVRSEDSEERFNNSMTREFFPNWTGANWNFQLAPFNQNKRGSLLRMWDDANISSVGNGEDDGVLFTAAKVSGPDGQGFYRYEYALHNRDMLRGIDSVTLPLRPGATIQNFGFRDIDDDPGNDWSFSFSSGSLTVSGSQNPLRWNTVYNFWFESDVPFARVPGVVGVADPGPGADQLQLDLRAPVGPLKGNDLGFAKAGGNGLQPSFLISGSFATGDQADFQIRYSRPNLGLIFVLSNQSNPTSFNGGTLVPLPFLFMRFFTADGEGTWTNSVPGQSWGGPPLYAQFVIFDDLASKGTAISNAREFVLD